MTDSRRGWKRNVSGLQTRAREKAAATRHRAEEAIRRLVKEGRPITFKAVAKTAPCSTAWLYAHTDIKERIVQLRSQQPSRPTITIPPRERASDASKDTLIAALRKVNKALRAENATLRKQLEVVYGELAARDQRRDRNLAT